MSAFLNINGSRLFNVGAFKNAKEGEDSDMEAPNVLAAIDMGAIDEEYSWDTSIATNIKSRSTSMPHAVASHRQRSGLGGSGPLGRLGSGPIKPNELSAALSVPETSTSTS